MPNISQTGFGWIPVVALALENEGGEILLQRRPLNKHHGGAWEFPGGKVESGEKPRIALAREVAEELGIALDPASLRPLVFAEEPGEAAIVLMLYAAPARNASPEGREGQSWGWFSRDRAAALDLAPMDADLLARLPASG